jgi:tetratricopeptide (TPR) repeat protein
VADAEPETYLGAGARYRIEQIEQGRADAARARIVYINAVGYEAGADALLKLGLIYESKLEDYSSAIEFYQQVIEDYPGTPKAAQAQANVGYIYLYKTYDYKKAFEELKKVNEENYPGSGLLAKEAEDSLRKFNKISQEIKKYQQVIRGAQKKKIRPGKAVGHEVRSIYSGVIIDTVGEAHLAIGRKWRQLKNYPRAIKIYKQLIERMPLHLRRCEEARYSIAEIYQLDQGRYVEAIDAYHEYLLMHPTSFRRGEAVYSMALCYEVLKMYDEVYERYKEYCDNYPEGKLVSPARRKMRQYELKGWVD